MKDEQKETVIVTGNSYSNLSIVSLSPPGLLSAGRCCCYSHLTNKEAETQRG